MKNIPIYKYPADYARDNGELEQYRASMKANRDCKSAIETAIRDNFDGMHLAQGTVKTVTSQFGFDRVFYVLANTVRQKSWDGRFSQDNKAWANTVPIFVDKDAWGVDRCGSFLVESHPAVLDGFISQARREYLLTQPLAREDIEREAGRLLRVLKAEPEPNSPAGTHFMAQLSPDFLVRASTKDHDRLYAMLPYKSLTFSNLSDRRGLFAFIQSDENRDQPLRPYPSRTKRSQQMAAR